MIWSEFEFDADAMSQVLAVIDQLPREIRPIYYCDSEDDKRTNGNGFELNQTFADFVSKRPGGFLLQGKHVQYDLTSNSVASFLKADAEAIREFAVRMAGAQPVFGYAATEEERYWRNNVTVTIGENTGSVWVGRNYKKYVPGLYWLTAISQTLADQHGIPLNTLAENAVKYTQIGTVYCFEFYRGNCSPCFGDW